MSTEQQPMLVSTMNEDAAAGIRALVIVEAARHPTLHRTELAENILVRSCRIVFQVSGGRRFGAYTSISLRNAWPLAYEAAVMPSCQMRWSSASNNVQRVGTALLISNASCEYPNVTDEHVGSQELAIARRNQPRLDSHLYEATRPLALRSYSLVTSRIKCT